MCGICNSYFSIIVGDIWQAWWESLCINYALQIISIYEYICINYHNTSRILGLKIIFLCYVKQTFRVQPSPPYKCISAQSSGYGLPTHVKFGCHQLPPWKIQAVFLISFSSISVRFHLVFDKLSSHSLFTRHWTLRITVMNSLSLCLIGYSLWKFTLPKQRTMNSTK